MTAAEVQVILDELTSIEMTVSKLGNQLLKMRLKTSKLQAIVDQAIAAAAPPGISTRAPRIASSN